jgi:hypothetical protein
VADAFNLIWKMVMVKKFSAPLRVLESYEAERRPVALSVIESSGELVRATKFSEAGTHAEDYVKIVQKRAGNITGMGIRYGSEGPEGTRLHDLMIGGARLYSLLDYSRYTLLLFGEAKLGAVPEAIRVMQVYAPESIYAGQAVLVRPDAYIARIGDLDHAANLVSRLWN